MLNNKLLDDDYMYIKYNIKAYVAIYANYTLYTLDYEILIYHSLKYESSFRIVFFP